MKVVKNVLILGSILLYFAHPFSSHSQSRITGERVANINVYAGSGEPILNGVCSYDKSARCLNIKLLVTNASGTFPMELNYFYSKDLKIEHFDILCEPCGKKKLSRWIRQLPAGPIIG